MPIHRVYEIMTSDVITASKDACLDNIIERLITNNISTVVIAENKFPLGIITERDITKIAINLSDDPAIYNMPVSNFMSANPVTIYRNADILTALEKMDRHRIRRLVVTDKDDKLDGLITYSDIVKKLEEDFFKIHTPIETVMTKGILKIAPDETLKKAIDIMSAEKKSCILVLSNDRPVGILTERDIVKFCYRRTPLDTPVEKLCTRNIVYVNQDTLLYDAIKIMNERGIRHIVGVGENFKLSGIVTHTDIINLINENVRTGIKDHLQKIRESLDIWQTGLIEIELNETGTILWINKFGAKELGFEGIDEAVGSSFAGILKDRSQWDEFVAKAVANSAVSFIFKISDKVIDCSFRTRRFSANGIFRDITDKFLEAEHIKSEKNRFENILKTLSEGLIVYDSNGVIKEINDAALNVFNTTKDKTIGKSLQSLDILFMDETEDIIGYDSLCINKVIENLIAIKNIIRGIKKKDGSITWFTASITPILDSKNDLKEIVHVITDITDIYNLEKRNQMILETAREGYWEVDLKGEIIKANKALSNLLGYSTEELIGKSIYDLVDIDKKYIFEKALERRKGGISDSYEMPLKNKNGTDIYAIVSASPRMDSSGKIQGSFAFITDVTDLKSTHNMLHTIASFYKDLSRALIEKEAYDILKHYLLSIKNNGKQIDAIYLMSIDPNKHYTEDAIVFNKSGLQEINKFPGIDKCKAYIYTGTFLINDLSKDYGCPFHRLGAKTGSYICTSINIGGSVTGILHLYSKEANFFSERVKEQIDSFLALFAPVVNNMRLLEMNKKLALVDPLTGLYNRRYLEAFMEKQLAITERNKQSLSLTMIDIDDFKLFNDTYGHEAGDTALRAISEAISNNIRSSDIGVRYGGEEFIVVLPNTDKTGAFDVAERIRNVIETTPLKIGKDKKAFLTASFGIAAYGIDAGSLTSLIAAADNALYNAKKTGKNKVCLT